MRDTTTRPPADAELSLAALRYAAGEMPAAEAHAFETRLGDDQSAREALAEAVRLSAAASGAPAPAPDPLLRQAVAERLHPTWLSRVFPRRPYRGHPAVWAGLGGGVAAAVALTFAFSEAPRPVAVAAAGDGTVTPVFVSAAPLPADSPAPPVSLAPATAGAQLNPMGMDKRATEALGSGCPVPVLSPMPTAITPVVPSATKPADDKLAEGPAEANPMGDPHVGMMMSRL